MPSPRHTRLPANFAAALASVLLPASASAELRIDIDFPGGSGVVLDQDRQTRTLTLAPSDHTDRGWRCWWYFKLEGIEPGQAFTLDLGDAPWATPDRASYSLDGKTWQQTPPGTRQGKRIRYTLSLPQETAWIAWGPPFLPADAEALVRQLDASPHGTAFELCRTREGRPVPAARITSPEGDASSRDVVWVHARQHAWEAGSSWVGRGLAEWLISEETAARELRRRAVVYFVPIMDIDNVHRGAGGKSQKPQDHNRDWTEEPHWRSVAAAQSRLREADEDRRLVLFIDLHNPGARDLFPFYFVVPRDMLSPIGRRNLDRFVDVSVAEIDGPLKLTSKTRESGPGYDPKAWQAISKNWVTEHCAEHVVAVTLETSWNTPASTSEGYQKVGQQLGRAIERYLIEDPRRAATDRAGEPPAR